ncbi:MAG: tetratricopeptide repeat protein [Gammaproteobacteria bacterium]|nr:tetratricopeptide repeat protein [Gammaproteobacteria bacterium]
MRFRQLSLALLLLMALTGCQPGQVREGEPQGDLIELKQQAEAAYGAKDYAKALSLYQRLAAQVPKDALIWFRLGNVQARLNRPADAIASYEKAVLLDPSLSRAWHNMGLLQLRQSANSFTQMAQLTRSGDPLAPRAMQLSEGTLTLLGKGKASSSAAE